MIKKLSVILSIVLLASMLLTACGPTATQAPAAPVKETIIVGGTPEVVYVTVPPEEPPPPVDTGEGKTLRVSFGYGDVPTLDPSLSTDTSSVQVVDELTVGVTRLDEVTLELKPGMAKDWDISADGTVYTLYLEENIPWVRWNGTEVEEVLDCDGNVRYVTAEDFVYGIKRTCDPRTASDYAYVLGFALAGCNDLLAGDSESEEFQALIDGVGAKAIDDYTLELTFLTPAAYNLNIAGMWIARAEPSWIIEGDDCTEARGDRWTEPGFNQAYGPYVLKEWIHDSTLTIVKNPFWPGIDSAPQAKIDTIVFSMLDTPVAFAEYEAGNLDVSGIPQADIDRVKADPVLSAELYQGFSGCTYYYGFNTSRPPVDNVHLRRAFSHAVDRQALIDNVLKAGQLPAQWFCRPGMVACPTPDNNPDVGIKTDMAAAQAELELALADMGLASVDELPEIVLMYNTSEGHKNIAEAIQQMWVDTLGIKVSLTNQEWAVYLKTVKSADAPHIWRMGWCLDYPDANNWLKEVMSVGGSSNSDENADGVPDGGLIWLNETYEQLVNDGAVEQDPDKRLDMYIQAENILVYEDAAIIPLYFYTSLSVSKPYLDRTYSMHGHDAYEKWDIIK